MSNTWGMHLGAPTTVAVARDRSDDTALTLREAANGAVQLLIGAAVTLVLTREGERIPVAGTGLGERVLTRVTGIERVAAEEGAAARQGTGRTGLRAGRAAAPPAALFEDTPLFEEAVVSSAGPAPFDAVLPVPEPPPALFDPLPSEEAVTPLAAPSFRVRVSHGRSVDVHEVVGSLFVGRSPALPDDADASPYALVALDAAADRVSATHLQLRVEAGRLLARDLWSANGTLVSPPGEAPFRLGAGEQLPVVSGTRLALGGAAFVDVEGVEAGADLAEGQHRGA